MVLSADADGVVITDIHIFFISEKFVRFRILSKKVAWCGVSKRLAFSADADGVNGAVMTVDADLAFSGNSIQIFYSQCYPQNQHLSASNQ